MEKINKNHNITWLTDCITDFAHVAILAVLKQNKTQKVTITNVKGIQIQA